jgi:hypothetical protein
MMVAQWTGYCPSSLTDASGAVLSGMGDAGNGWLLFAVRAEISRHSFWLHAQANQANRTRITLSIKPNTDKPNKAP